MNFQIFLKILTTLNNKTVSQRFLLLFTLLKCLLFKLIKRKTSWHQTNRRHELFVTSFICFLFPLVFFLISVFVWFHCWYRRTRQQQQQKSETWSIKQSFSIPQEIKEKSSFIFELFSIVRRALWFKGS